MASSSAAGEASSFDLLKTAYGTMADTVGQTWRTVGHDCLTAADVKAALDAGGSNLLYGELLPAGLSKMLDAEHLDIARAAVVLELGMGTGKLAMQVFLQQAQVRRVLGVELARSRTEIGVAAMRALAAAAPERFAMRGTAAGAGELIETGTCAAARVEAASAAPRELLFESGDMFATPHAELAGADVVIMETCVPSALYGKLSRLLLNLRVGCRIVVFDDVNTIWAAGRALEAKAAGAATQPPLPPTPPFSQMPANVPDSDRFPTSWAPEKGQHFFVYERVERGGPEAPAAAAAVAAAADSAGMTVISADGAEGALAPMFATGDAVEVKVSWSPGHNDDLLLEWMLTGGEETFFRGWVTGVKLKATADKKEGAAQEVAGEGDGEDEQQEDDEAAVLVADAGAADTTLDDGHVYTVLYDDGDVEEHIATWRLVPWDGVEKNTLLKDAGPSSGTARASAVDMAPALASALASASSAPDAGAPPAEETEIEFTTSDELSTYEAAL